MQRKATHSLFRRDCGGKTRREKAGKEDWNSVKDFVEQVKRNETEALLWRRTHGSSSDP